MPFTNPDLKRRLLPTVDQVINYLEKANRENTPTVKRDVRYLMSMLQRLLEGDPYLMGLVQSRKLACRSYKWNIRLPLQYKITPVEEKQLAETKTRFARSRMIKLLDNILDGILFGMDAVNTVWKNTPLGTMVVEKNHYDLTELDFADESEGLMHVVTHNNGLPVFTPLDPETHIITRHNPLPNRKNYVGSFIRSVMLLSYLKYVSKWDWKNLNSRHGNPSTYATYPEHLDPDNEEDKKKILAVGEMVEKLKNDAAAVFPEWVKIIFDTALKSDQTNSFKSFVEAANLEMAITLHGQNLTTEVKQGSKAAATVHDRVDDLIIISDLKIAEDIFTAQYLKKDYLLNYGEPKNDFFEFYFVIDEQQDFESNSRVIQNIFSDPILKEKLPLKKSEVYEKLNFTPPQEGDEIL
ncbi:MAG: DUF935 family protein [Bacteroidota bacterium]